MTTEIELKYLVNDEDIVSRLSTLLTEKGFSYQLTERELSNHYFDSKDLTLRAMDMGLRIRCADQFCEQTIKTKGRTVGGLHQRPEYNVTIDTHTPRLDFFPDDIWPATTNVAELEQALIVLFTTHFKRHTWLVNTPQGQVEIAYDIGTICADGICIAINELELELVSGEQLALFTLATSLFEQFALIAGTESKAARGYQLWHNKSEAIASEMYLPALLADLNGGMSISKSFIAGLTFGLERLQKAIAYGMSCPSLPVVKSVYESIAFIGHGLALYQPLLSSKLGKVLIEQAKQLIDTLSWLENAQHIDDLTMKTGKYRKKIEYSKQLVSTLNIERSRFPNEQDIKALISGNLINQFQLGILQLLIMPDFDESQTEVPLSQFAFNSLEQSLTELTTISEDKSSLAPIEYVIIQHHLNRSLLTGSWFGNLYDAESRVDYRRPWLDVLEGSEELSTLFLLNKELKSLSETSDKLVMWLDSKIEHLTSAIEQSYHSAITIAPYWR